MESKVSCSMLFVMFVLLSVGDYIGTLLIIAHGSYELNPIGLSLMNSFGMITGLLLLKIIGIFSGLIILIYKSRSKLPDTIHIGEANFSYRVMILAVFLMTILNLYHVLNYYMVLG